MAKPAEIEVRERATVERQMRFFETEGRRIPVAIGPLATMFKLFGIPKGWDK
jgi:hypothetical protein